MKKRILSFILILAMVVFPTMSLAEGGPAVNIDSTRIEFTEDSGVPFIDKNYRTLVPVRLTMEAYGVEVEWNAETETAILKKGDIVVEIPVGKSHILVNGELIETDTESINKDGRVYLPIRAVVESFGSEVQWNQETQTVNILSTVADARATILNAYAKSYDWDNYDMSMTMNMVMPIPGMDGSLSEMNMIMEMNATAFMNPMKLKATSNMVIDMFGDQMSQPLMEMYMLVEKNIISTYVGTYDENGAITWLKTSEENEMFSELLDNELNKELNKELNEQSIKNIKYLGNKIVGEKTLGKYEVTTSFETYNEFMGEYMNMLSATSSDEDLMVLDMIANLDDITFLIYVDESIGEISRYEMDLSSLMVDMLKSMSESLEIPEEELAMLETMKINVTMDVSNINTAKDFKIPKEALNAEVITAE